MKSYLFPVGVCLFFVVVVVSLFCLTNPQTTPPVTQPTATQHHWLTCYNFLNFSFKIMTTDLFSTCCIHSIRALCANSWSSISFTFSLRLRNSFCLPLKKNPIRLQIKPHCLLRTRVLHHLSLDSTMYFLKVRLCIPLRNLVVAYGTEVISDLSGRVWAVTTERRTEWKKHDQVEQSVCHSLLSSTSHSLSLLGIYCRCLPNTMVVSNSAETAPTISMAVVTHHLETALSFINMCQVVGGLGTEHWALPRDSLHCWVSAVLLLLFPLLPFSSPNM